MKYMYKLIASLTACNVFLNISSTILLQYIVLVASTNSLLLPDTINRTVMYVSQQVKLNQTLVNCVGYFTLNFL